MDVQALKIDVTQIGLSDILIGRSNF